MKDKDAIYFGNGNSAVAPVEMKKFGTFQGVFLPTIMTILGVVIFLRANFVIGQAGIIGALLILALGKTITTLTVLSISAIASNTEIKGGGTYYLISRAIGPEFGGAIAVTNFFAQALSIPFYLIGFSEALVATFHIINIDLSIYYDIIAYAIFAIMAFISFKGAAIVLKAQFVVLIIMGLSIASFLIGAALKFDPAIFAENLHAYSGDGEGLFKKLSFFTLLAIYFPSVTGILSGVNMSGDLKNPAHAIPFGTLMAILVSFLIYAAQMILDGGSMPRADLIGKPYDSLVNLWHPFTTVLVVLGVLACTLSNALGTILGAPRVLQALAQDKILKPVNIFAKVTPQGEPRRALIATLVIGFAVIYFACGNGNGGGNALNMVAAIVAMFFLLTYGIINYAAFIESYSRNPSFRPRFKFFHWFPALVGAIASFVITLLINPIAAFFAGALFVGLFFYVRKYVMSASFGDARRGFIYSRTRDNLLSLSALPIHAKNWRPTAVLFAGDPERRLHLIKYADWLSSSRGILTIAAMLRGNFVQMIDKRTETITSLNNFFSQNNIKAFPEVLVTPEFNMGMSHFLQVNSIGPIKPNLAIFGWSSDPTRAYSFMTSIQTAASLNMSVALICGKELPPELTAKELRRKGRTIDIWWRGMRNGSLMVILAYLLSLNSEWSGAKIRILRMVNNEEEKDEARDELVKLIDAARMDADIETFVSDDSFPNMLKKYSGQSTVVFLGFSAGANTDPVRFQEGYTALLPGMPMIILIQSTGEADLLS